MVADPSLSVTLRSAQDEDVARMAAIEARAFSDPWPASAFAELLRQPHARVVVAERAPEGICGYCVMLHVLDEGEIANIAVAPESWRRGVAGRLLDEALREARSIGLTSVFLEVRLSNVAARRLYESRGFAPIGRRRAYYREPLEDALVLRWQPSQ